MYVSTFDDVVDDDAADRHDEICKCINFFFISQLIFFNDPSKFVYSEGAFCYEAGFFNSGQGP